MKKKYLVKFETRRGEKTVEVETEDVRQVTDLAIKQLLERMGFCYIILTEVKLLEKELYTKNLK